MRVLHRPLCLSRQARRIRQVGGWTSMGFLNPSWTLQGAAWWASTPALPLGRQQLGEGLAKGIHSPLLYTHIKGEGIAFLWFAQGFFTGSQSTAVGLSHCVSSLLWGLTAQHCMTI